MPETSKQREKANMEILFCIAFYSNGLYFKLQGDLRGDRMMETFEKYSILFKVKAGENLALTLHFVQPEEYIEYFED
jgi:hypothetical protein